MKIIVDNVSKNMKNSNILDNISCQFDSGNIYGIVGENGSGKTMLLRTIIGLMKPTSGSIKLDNEVIGQTIDFPPSVGIIIEKPEFISYLSGYENLKLIAEVKKIISDEKIKEYMRKFSLDPESKKTMKKYSLGMKQKIGIIQAIMEEPELLILDEPFNALDKDSVEILRKILLEFKEQGKLIIITSHHSDDIESICNATISIKDGRIQNN